MRATMARVLLSINAEHLEKLFNGGQRI